MKYSNLEWTIGELINLIESSKNQPPSSLPTKLYLVLKGSEIVN